MIEPSPGHGLAYVDFEQQEFGIAAALSNDPAMLAAYRSGDPYLEFARQAGVVPSDATKTSHPAERELFKLCALGVQYGMEAGFELRTEAKLVRYPDHYSDPRGERMWQEILSLL